jgi:transcriptional regulator with XRE-family HTH domain
MQAPNDNIDPAAPEGADAFDRHIGKLLKLRRNTQSLSQEQLGKAIGVTFQQIQKYERGTNRITFGNMYRLAQFLKVPISWFVDNMPENLVVPTGFGESKQSPLDDAPSPSTAVPDDVLARKETADLLRVYYGITEPKKRKILLEKIKTWAAGQNRQD